MSQGIAAQLIALRKIVQRDKSRKGRMVVMKPRQRKVEKKKISADKLQLSGMVVRSEVKEITYVMKGQNRTSLGGNWFMWLDKASIQGAVEHARTMGREKCGAEVGPDGQSIRLFSKPLTEKKVLEYSRLIASLLESRQRRPDELEETYRAADEKERDKNAAIALDLYMKTEFVELREGSVIKVGSFSGGTEASMMAGVQFARATAYNIDGCFYMQPIKGDDSAKDRVTDYRVGMSVNTNYVRMNSELSSIPFLLRLPVNPVCRSGGGIGVGAVVDCKRFKRMGVPKFGSFLVAGWRNGLNPSDSTHTIRLAETYRPDDAAAKGYSDVSVWSRVTAIEDEWTAMRKLTPSDANSADVEAMCAKINLVYTEDLDLIGAVENADPETGVLDYNRSAVCYDMMVQLWDRNCAPLGMATSVAVWKEMMQAHDISAVLFGNVKTDDTISAIANTEILASNEPKNGPYWAMGVGPMHGTVCLNPEGIQWRLPEYLMEHGVRITEATARNEAFLRVITKAELGGGLYVKGGLSEIEWPINVPNSLGIASGAGWVGDIDEFLDAGLPSSVSNPMIPEKCPFTGKPPTPHLTRPRRTEVEYRVLLVPQVDKGRDKVTKQMITVSEALPVDVLKQLAKLSPEEGSALFEEGGKYEQAQTVVYALRPSVCARMTLTDSEAGQFRGGGAGVKIFTKKYQETVEDEGEEGGGVLGVGQGQGQGPIVEYTVVSPVPAGPVFSKTWEEAVRANKRCIGEETASGENAGGGGDDDEDEEGSDMYDSVLEPVDVISGGDGGGGSGGNIGSKGKADKEEDKSDVLAPASEEPMDVEAEEETIVEIPAPPPSEDIEPAPVMTTIVSEAVEEIEEIEEAEDTGRERGRKRSGRSRSPKRRGGDDGDDTGQQQQGEEEDAGVPTQPKRRVFAPKGGKKGR